MRCEEVRERLDDHIEGALRPTDVADVAAHLETCAECRGEERAIRALVAAAARLPREIAPDRDLWPGIAQRIDRRFHFGSGWSGLQWALAAAALVVVAVGGLVVSSSRQDQRPVVATATLFPSATPNARTVSTVNPSTLATAEGEFERASAELLQALESRRGSLPPNTIEDLKNHLAAIDTALDEIRAVLRDNPGNAEATRLLASTQRRKVDVLRRVVGLSRI